MPRKSSRLPRRFRQLPRELRHTIYLLATPSRIVHVQYEQETEDAYMARVDSIDFDKIQVPLSLSFFAKEFREMMLFYKDWYKSWPMINVPLPAGFNGVPYTFYILEAFLQKSYFYSTAPIPALLHTCVESRSVLINAGYRLAFGARDHQPMTWFHFQHDVLYLRHPPDFISWLGCHVPTQFHYCLYSIGKLDMESLMNVRKLALSEVYIIYEKGWAFAVTRLISKLDRLYLVIWNKDVVSYRQGYTTVKARRIADKKGESAYKKELWRHVPIEPVDTLFEYLVDMIDPFVGSLPVIGRLVLGRCSFLYGRAI